jgi:hypothetical protein
MRALALTPLFAIPAVKAAQTDAINAPAISMTKVDRSAWDAAFARYEAVLAEANSFWRNVEDRADKMLERYSHAEARLRRLIDFPAMHERSNAYGEAVAVAKHDLRNTPAPTLTEVAIKSDLFFGDDERSGDGYCPAWHHETLEPFFADLRRFAGEAAA